MKKKGINELLTAEKKYIINQNREEEGGPDRTDSGREREREKEKKKQKNEEI